MSGHDMAGGLPPMPTPTPKAVRGLQARCPNTPTFSPAPGSRKRGATTPAAHPVMKTPKIRRASVATPTAAHTPCGQQSVGAVDSRSAQKDMTEWRRRQLELQDAPPSTPAYIPPGGQGIDFGRAGGGGDACLPVEGWYPALPADTLSPVAPNLAMDLLDDDAHVAELARKAFSVRHSSEPAWSCTAPELDLVFDL